MRVHCQWRRNRTKRNKGEQWISYSPRAHRGPTDPESTGVQSIPLESTGGPVDPPGVHRGSIRSPWSPQGVQSIPQQKTDRDTYGTVPNRDTYGTVPNITLNPLFLTWPGMVARRRSSWENFTQTVEVKSSWNIWEESPSDSSSDISRRRSTIFRVKEIQ